jgi:hypothetical protein
MGYPLVWSTITYLNIVTNFHNVFQETDIGPQFKEHITNEQN